MKFWAIFHKETRTYFPHITHGSSMYDFFDPPKKTRYYPPIPRLFNAKWQAQRYITEYCKGIKADKFERGEPSRYIRFTRERKPEHFQIVPILLVPQETR